MIRPITCICFLLACGSGLYLYQAKHRVQLLDRQIQDTVQAADKVREQSRVLHAEWTLLNDPQRLQALADQFLTLKTVQPNQFVSAADMGSRLPPVPPPPPPETVAPTPAAPPSMPVAEAPSSPAPQREAASAPTVAAAPAPAAPPTAVKPAVAVASAPAPSPPPRPPEHKPAPPPPAPHPVVADARPEPRLVRPVMATVGPRPAAPQSASYGGSALGMARTAAPLPQPTPIGASQWVSSGGGGG
jgi:hypothetical protein